MIPNGDNLLDRRLNWGNTYILVLRLHSMNRQYGYASNETEPLLRRITDSDMTSSAPESSPIETAPEVALARRVVKKIDRVIIPLLFVTYMLNFMDKVILSSAAVFGLREDAVRNHNPQRQQPCNKNLSTHLYSIL